MRSQQVVPVNPGNITLPVSRPQTTTAKQATKIYKLNLNLAWLIEDYDFYTSRWLKIKDTDVYPSEIIDFVRNARLKAEDNFVKADRLSYELSKESFGIYLKLLNLEAEVVQAALARLAATNNLKNNVRIVNILRYTLLRGKFDRVNYFPQDKIECDKALSEIKNVEAEWAVFYKNIQTQDPVFVPNPLIIFNTNLTNLVAEINAKIQFNLARLPVNDEKLNNETQRECKSAPILSSNTSTAATLQALDLTDPIKLKAELKYFGFNKVKRKLPGKDKTIVIGFDIDETLVNTLLNGQIEFIQMGNLFALLNEIDLNWVEVVAITSRYYPEDKNKVSSFANDIINLLEMKLGFSIFTSIYYTSSNSKNEALLDLNNIYFAGESAKRGKIYLVDDREGNCDQAQPLGFSTIQADQTGQHIDFLRKQLEKHRALKPPQPSNTNLIKPIALRPAVTFRNN